MLIAKLGHPLGLPWLFSNLAELRSVTHITQGKANQITWGLSALVELSIGL